MKRPCPLCRRENARHERTLGEYCLVRCTSCGFVYADMTAGQIEAENFSRDDEMLEHYAKIRTVLDTAFFEFVAKRINRIAGKPCDILDVGCGSGLVLKALRRRGWQCHGLDPSPYAQKCADGYTVHPLPLRDLSTDQMFHVVSATAVIEHVADPQGFLGRMLGHVKPGGFAYLTAPNYGSLAVRLGLATFKTNRPPQHVNYFTPRVVRQLIRKVVEERSPVYCIRSYGIPEAYICYSWFTSKRKSMREAKKSTHWAELIAACYFHVGRPFRWGDKLEITVRKPAD